MPTRCSNRMLLFVAIILILTSCSKDISGEYYYKKGSEAYGYFQHLELNKDNTFKCTYHEHYNQGDDVVGPSYDYLGVGNYVLKRGKLILNFNSKFKRIDTIVITKLSMDDEYQNPRYANLVYLVVNFHFFSRLLKAPISVGQVTFNYKPVTAMHDVNLSFDDAKFPYTINIDFEKFGFSSYQDPNRRNVNIYTNLGFDDEKIKVDKPGRYQVDIYPYQDGYGVIEDKVLMGKDTMSIRKIFSTRIEKMKKVHQ